ncbi:CatB-related O-acetyltransferase [Ancylomarina sp. 16SWW S1-10-2]|uniref:CatB-related O-acetyltransferase n=1 Tax=Ancylomarina sp. 16SWW S1-10-2 TaxID=2499681 RepID=UPI0012AD9AE4|nr:CatB-related O-acetyltransferase [Ancylomarina sp. 16SWW S1-10-2]MRT93435.1 CatB-related O-acetyltransferase [Ancylomarina sp. 16SWW S1-10-2]
MRSIVFKIRKLFWRFLGFSYENVLRNNDTVYLSSDPYTEIGEHTYENGAKIWRWTKAKVIIGKFCSIANGVNFIVDEAFHNSSSITSFPIFNNLFDNNEILNMNTRMTCDDFKDKHIQKQGIIIGNDVWIGMGAYVMPGVIVGNGVVIAANSVVTKDIPHYAIVAGVPAKIIRFKYSDSIIERLNTIKWWNWRLDDIKDRIQDFELSAEEFTSKYLR